MGETKNRPQGKHPGPDDPIAETMNEAGRFRVVHQTEKLFSDGKEFAIVQAGYIGEKTWAVRLQIPCAGIDLYLGTQEAGGVAYAMMHAFPNAALKIFRAAEPPLHETEG